MKKIIFAALGLIWGGRISTKFEVLFRLYGPEKPLFDKTWKLPDIERIAAQ